MCVDNFDHPYHLHPKLVVATSLATYVDFSAYLQRQQFEIIYWNPRNKHQPNFLMPISGHIGRPQACLQCQPFLTYNANQFLVKS
jgi:hypothetical protein